MLAEDSAAQLAELERMTRPGGVLDHWAAAGVRASIRTLGTLAREEQEARQPKAESRRPEYIQPPTHSLPHSLTHSPTELTHPIPTIS